MNKAELKQKLKKYDYSYKEEFSAIIIKLDYSLEITVDFDDSEKVIIRDKLKSWNFLTGVWEMSIKSSLVLNIFLSAFYAAVLLFVNNFVNDFNYYKIMLVLYILAVCWLILWTIFYLIKAESVKILIQSWDK